MFYLSTFHSIAFLGAGTFLLLCGYLGEDTISAVLLLTIAVGSLGFALAGFNVNHLDIAPRFAGILMGITNTAATIPGFVGPVVAKSIAVEVGYLSIGHGFYTSTFEGDLFKIDISVFLACN